MADSNSTPVVKACKKCGTSDRYSDGRCRTCSRKKCSEYISKNKEIYYKKNKEWKERNKDRAAESAAKWAENNKEKVAANLKAWRKANPEKVKLINARSYARNSVKFLAQGKEWWKANPEKTAKYSTDWVKKNPEEKRIHGINRRSKIAASSGSITNGLSKKLFDLQKGKCACCSQPLGSDYHMDHIMPLALGGSNTDDNMQLLRAICNKQKHAKHPVDFMQSRGFLL